MSLYTIPTYMQILKNAPKTLITTYAQAALTPQAHIVLGNAVASKLFSWMNTRLALFRGATWYNLLREDQHPLVQNDLPSVASVRFPTIGLKRRTDFAIETHLQMIPWWATYQDCQSYLGEINIPVFWHNAADFLLNLTDGRVPYRTIHERTQKVGMALSRSLQQSEQLVEGAAQFYHFVVQKALGQHFVPATKPMSYLASGSRLAGPILASWNPDEFRSVLRDIGAAGDPYLFFGPALALNHLLLKRSPRQCLELDFIRIGLGRDNIWRAERISTLTGNKVLSTPIIDFDLIVRAVMEGKLAPVGKAAMLLFLTDKSIVHQGAENGIRAKIEQCRLRTGIGIHEPHNSWPPIVITNDGTSTEVELHEMYILFGPQNPSIIELVNESIAKGKPIVMTLQKAQELMA